MCNLDHILMWSLTVFKECECVSKEQHEGHSRLQALVQCDDSYFFTFLALSQVNFCKICQIKVVNSRATRTYYVP